MTTPELSVVVPCHNEAENLRPLLAAIHAALDPLSFDYEIVIPDDCSSDDSWRVLQELSATDPRLRAQRFEFNGGESSSGIKQSASRGQESLRRLESPLQIVSRFACRALDEIEKIALRNC